MSEPIGFIAGRGSAAARRIWQGAFDIDLAAVLTLAFVMTSLSTLVHFGT